MIFLYIKIIDSCIAAWITFLISQLDFLTRLISYDHAFLITRDGSNLLILTHPRPLQNYFFLTILVAVRPFIQF